MFWLIFFSFLNLFSCFMMVYTRGRLAGMKKTGGIYSDVIDKTQEHMNFQLDFIVALYKMYDPVRHKEVLKSLMAKGYVPKDLTDIELETLH